jgi:hypothetical protein
MKNEKKNNEKSKENEKESELDENELKDIVQDYNYEQLKFLGDNKSTNSNVKITNITNIILNVKNIPKSLDITSNNNKDYMLRDMRSLHIITQRALSSNSKINSLIDSFDNNERKNFINFKVNNKKEFSNNNSDYENKIKVSKTDKNSQIINIININNNYSVENNSPKTSFRIGKNNSKDKNIYESYKTNKTKLTKLPNKNSVSSVKSKNKKIEVGLFLKSMKSKIKKEKFVSITKTKK